MIPFGIILYLIAINVCVSVLSEYRVVVGGTPGTGVPVTARCNGCMVLHGTLHVHVCAYVHVHRFTPGSETVVHTGTPIINNVLYQG
eukprot:SAG31_NODE_1100_length_9905_cov_17.003977_1_plen_87_part_00